MKKIVLSALPKLVATLLVLAIAIFLSAVAVWLAGESPLVVLKVLTASAFGGVDNFTYTLFYMTPILLTGISVALALEANLFNIGAEGQLLMGALFAAVWAAVSRGWLVEPSMFVVAGVLLGGAFAAFAGGACWGGLAGFLRAKLKVHEVIATIMLNFVAGGIVNWAILYPLKNPDTQNLETVPLPEAGWFAPLWRNVTWGLPLAIIFAAVIMRGLRTRWWGFRVRATGQNERAARLAGIQVERTALLTMAVSGGVAGLVGFHEVFLHAHKLIDSFSPGFGFTGLAVALLARGNLTSLVLAAFLFGALHKGTLDLDLETERVTRDLSAVIQALILVALAVRPQLEKVTARWTRGSA